MCSILGFLLIIYIYIYIYIYIKWDWCGNLKGEEKKSKYFVGQLGELKILYHISFIVENFLGLWKLKIFENEKRKWKVKFELIKINLN